MAKVGDIAADCLVCDGPILHRGYKGKAYTTQVNTHYCSKSCQLQAVYNARKKKSGKEDYAVEF
jgi:hypothetical protein